jgi:hypothetical protein
MIPVVSVGNPLVIPTAVPSGNQTDSATLRVLQGLRANSSDPLTSTNDALLEELLRRRRQALFLPPLPQFFLLPEGFRPLIFDRVLGAETFFLSPNDPKAGVISGVIFEDYEGTGIRDNNKPPQPGVIVFVDLNNNGVLDYGEPTSITNHMGEYRFVGLKPGTYTIRQVLRPQVVQTYPPRGGQHVKLLEHEVISEVNFGAARVRQRRRPPRSSSNPTEPKSIGYRGSWEGEPDYASTMLPAGDRFLSSAMDRDGVTGADHAVANPSPAGGPNAELRTEPSSANQTGTISWSRWFGMGVAWASWLCTLHFRRTPSRTDESGPPHREVNTKQSN